MIESISHSFADESIDAKAKWFKALSIEERMKILVAFTNLILENNPEIAKKKHVRPASDRIRVLSKE
jgi:acyl-CoA reductase-like NAD-dependent aldehyde dehydrogenase